MKLAEALILRADTRKRLEMAKARLLRVVKVQEGDKPAEDPAALLTEIDTLVSSHTALIKRINRTNVVARLDDGRTLAEAIADRDGLRLRHSTITEAIDQAVIRQDRMTKGEIRFATTVNVAALQRQADDLAKDHRELDTKIQAANWTVELSD